MQAVDHRYMISKMASNLLLLFASFAAAACIIAMSLQCLRRQIGRNYSKLPPGYSIWSFLSDVRGIQSPCSPTSTGHFVDQRMQRYGKIFTINFLGSPAVVSADAELNQLVFVNDTRLFTDAWTGVYKEVMGRTNIALQVGDACSPAAQVHHPWLHCFGESSGFLF